MKSYRVTEPGMGLAFIFTALRMSHPSRSGLPRPSMSSLVEVAFKTWMLAARTSMTIAGSFLPGQLLSFRGVPRA